jgi:putative FmdB family regulatory protein
MPTYVYRCKSCEHEFETIQKMSDEPLKQCPVCDGVIVRLLFPPAISFKGSGFHVNDYPDTKSMVSGTSAKPSETKTPTTTNS